MQLQVPFERGMRYISYLFYLKEEGQSVDMPGGGVRPGNVMQIYVECLVTSVTLLTFSAVHSGVISFRKMNKSDE